METCIQVSEICFLDGRDYLNMFIMCIIVTSLKHGFTRLLFVLFLLLLL
jgi:hypothetical protein